MLTEISPTIEKRLLAKICKNQDTKCWEWIGTKNNRGYGELFTGGQHHRKLAHRISYELYKGLIPANLEIDHLCRVRHCINPDHLEAVTPKTNFARGRSLGALYKNSRFCRHGHEYTPENTLMNKANGRRECKTCRARNQKQFCERHPHYQRDISRKHRKSKLWTG